MDPHDDSIIETWLRTHHHIGDLTTFLRNHTATEIWATAHQYQDDDQPPIPFTFNDLLQFRRTHLTKH